MWQTLQPVFLHQCRREKSESAPTQAQQPMLTHSRNLRLWILGKGALPGAGWQASGSFWNSVTVGSSDSPSITGVEDTDSSVFSEPSEGKRKNEQSLCTASGPCTLRTACRAEGSWCQRHSNNPSPCRARQEDNTASEGQKDVWTAKAALSPFQVCPLTHFHCVKIQKSYLKCTVQW